LNDTSRGTNADAAQAAISKEGNAVLTGIASHAIQLCSAIVLRIDDRLSFRLLCGVDRLRQ
jgi:hypothetical protein